MSGVAAIYDAIGTTYARYRRPDPRVAAQIDAALGDAGTVLNVGAGTGSYEGSSRRYVAVEPSAVMLRQRGGDSASAVQAVAQHLPFAADTFDAATAICTVHHWPDPAAGLAEVRRVTRGPIVVLTWTGDDLAGFWLVAEYIPEAADHDRSLVAAPEIAALLGAYGPVEVEVVPVPHDCTDGFFAAYWRRPEMYLDRDAVAAISGLALLPPAALERMAKALRSDLESGAWHERHRDLLSRESADYGYRLVISRPA